MHNCDKWACIDKDALYAKLSFPVEYDIFIDCEPYLLKSIGLFQMTRKQKTIFRYKGGLNLMYRLDKASRTETMISHEKKSANPFSLYRSRSG